MTVKKILPILFLIFIFIIFLLPHFDNDFGWHYRCGEKIVKEGLVCQGGEFTYFLPNYHWANPNFLYDILIYLILTWFGFWGLAILGSLIFTAIVFILYFKSGLSPVIKIPLIYLIIFLSWDVFALGFRSQILSLLFVLLTLYLIFLSDEKRDFKKLIYLIPIFLIWANAHGGFFLGPLIYGVFVISKSIETLKRRESFENFQIILGVFLLCLIVTLINPFGFHIYEEAYRHFNAPLKTLIAEWVPPLITDTWLVVLFYLTFIILTLRNKKLKLFEFLTLTLFLFLALVARRNLPLFYFVYGFLLLYHFKFKLKRSYELPFQIILIAVILFALIVYAPERVKKTFMASTNFNKYCQTGYVTYPQRAVEFIKKNIPARQGKNVFNTYEWGGFLLWQLPEMNFFIDGRMPAWRGEEGKSPYTSWLEILQTQPGWNKKLDFYQTDYLLIGPGTFLDLLLKENPLKFDYQELYRDEVAVIYKKVISN